MKVTINKDRSISALHKDTGITVSMHYKSIAEAKRHNPNLINFCYVGD